MEQSLVFQGIRIIVLYINKQFKEINKILKLL